MCRKENMLMMKLIFGMVPRLFSVQIIETVSLTIIATFITPWILWIVHSVWRYWSQWRVTVFRMVRWS